MEPPFLTPWRRRLAGCRILGTNNNIGSISVITHMFGSTKLYKVPGLGQEAAREEKATADFLQNSPQ